MKHILKMVEQLELQAPVVMHRTLTDLKQILRAKNADYTAGQDEFHNFKMSADIAQIPVASGIITRMSDKLARVGGLVAGRKPNVVNESMEDTLKDLVGYACILLAWLELEAEDAG